MKEPILSREELGEMWKRAIEAHGVPHENFAAALESALLEKLCGEPCAWLVEGSRTFVDRAYMSESTADQHIADRGSDGSRKVPLYALNRSKA
ncbi:conserved hypothetical protein [Burkholderia diffusa]|uniref:hypothetical protein n=1 Tax=Burkholderia diffusa TaxID=488732 RepID=UPI001CB275D1|nr:hypothetical protein [Burkholderia diffusa]CAG9264038.1 conserved hypothetical protein [Burkholderia diffusa]